MIRRLPPLVLRWIRAAPGRSAAVLPDGRVRLREGARWLVLPSRLAAIDALVAALTSARETLATLAIAVR